MNDFVITPVFASRRPLTRAHLGGVAPHRPSALEAAQRMECADSSALCVEMPIQSGVQAPHSTRFATPWPATTGHTRLPLSAYAAHRHRDARDRLRYTHLMAGLLLSACLAAAARDPDAEPNWPRQRR